MQCKDTVSLHSQCQMQKMKKDKMRQEKCRRTYRHIDDRKSLASSAWQGWVGYLEGTGGVYVLVEQTGLVMTQGTGRSRCEHVICQSETAGTSHYCTLGCPPPGTVPIKMLIWIPL